MNPLHKGRIHGRTMGRLCIHRILEINIPNKTLKNETNKPKSNVCVQRLRRKRNTYRENDTNTVLMKSMHCKCHSNYIENSLSHRLSAPPLCRHMQPTQHRSNRDRAILDIGASFTCSDTGYWGESRCKTLEYSKSGRIQSKPL